jgi:hypothetical protein
MEKVQNLKSSNTNNLTEEAAAQIYEMTEVG